MRGALLFTMNINSGGRSGAAGIAVGVRVNWNNIAMSIAYGGVAVPSIDFGWLLITTVTSGPFCLLCSFLPLRGLVGLFVCRHGLFVLLFLNFKSQSGRLLSFLLLFFIR